MRKLLRFGHRGASGYEAENTLAAFEKAMQVGAEGIELDVHLSADGIIMVIHDDTVDRTTNGCGAIADLSFQVLKSFKIEDIHKIPTLNEVLDMVNRRCIVNIELKGLKMAKAVRDIIELYIKKDGWQYKEFLVSSFDWTSLAELKELNPEIRIAVLTETDCEKALSFAKQIEADAINPYYMVISEEMTKRIQENGLKVYPWAVNNSNDIDKLKSYGVDGIITDFPDRL